ncbi:LOW QUALITY PROTEIN: acyl-CoA:lysophosphatidylglycerol acyltransferase 1-like [Limulus polyphemus]|uniref:LOW QUALITY PROTEIN: acyl-CoA:lysophosphatidylglycerol acyltransferase 1-like n=1 Tax=Limulus polyphemus TaxID=6850 RepID=A0ABM1TCF5_LIMPO|nr:LOW QUALITY PROTEIN: acyl-CoA:lysophosphatidylglycerol acyltransferase 1-like [Limulus polyphemus]
MDWSRALHILKCIFRIIFVFINNLYCIPTYVMWTLVLLRPLRHFKPAIYWKIEGILFKWLLYMVAAWNWSAKYYIQEVGEDISSCVNHRSLILMNHQSTADVPLLMAAFQNKGEVLQNVTWVMDHLFRYTNFGVVSWIHGDFFIAQGKSGREVQLEKLRSHLVKVYLQQDRQWIILFPEGGFLRKRLESSQKYKRAWLSCSQSCYVPRIGALKVILNVLKKENVGNGIIIDHLNNEQVSVKKPEPLKWVIDITVGYPDGGRPLSLPTICTGSRPPCVTYMHYRKFPIDDIPSNNEEELRNWLFKRWQEKEEMLTEFYKTGKFPVSHLGESSDCGHESFQPVQQLNCVLWLCLNVFFIISTYFHCYLLIKLWQLMFW